MPQSQPGLVTQDGSFTFSIFVRAIGLRVFNSLRTDSRFGWNRDFREPKKSIIQSSLIIGLLRCIIHILPIFASTALIALNLEHLYLGATFPGTGIDIDIPIALLQIVAKIQELLIVASLGTIVWHVVRSALVNGDGLPFGMITSGFKFSDLSFFWSPEFVCFFWAKISKWKKFSITALLLTCGLISTTAGPATAVLAIPRQQNWTIGSTEFYLRGTENELFPSVMTSNSSYAKSACTNSSNFGFAPCLSGGFYTLASTFKAMVGLPRDNSLPNRPPFSTLSNDNVIPGSGIYGVVRGWSCHTAAMALYMPVTMLQGQISKDVQNFIANENYNAKQLWTVSASQYKTTFARTYTTVTKAPVVRTVCTASQTISRKDKNVIFPKLLAFGCWENSNITTPVALNNTPSTSFRTSWVDLPTKYGTTSAGMVFEAPWFDSNSSRFVVGCSIDARWAISHQQDSKATPIEQDPEEHRGRWSPFLPPANSSAWTSIHLEESWLNMLDTEIPTQNNSYSDTAGVTVLESLLRDAEIINSRMINSKNKSNYWDEQAKTLALEWVVTLLVLDGLSRHASASILNLTGDPSEWYLLDYSTSEDFGIHFIKSDGQALRRPEGVNVTNLTVTASLPGYGYQASQTTDYLAIAVLLGHITIALGYIFFIVAINHQTSHSWDSISELVALAYTSTPSASLPQNISAGITRIHTLATITKIRAVRVEQGSDQEQSEQEYKAELVFSEASEQPDEASTGRSEQAPARSTSITSAMTYPLGPGRFRGGDTYSTAFVPAEQPGSNTLMERLVKGSTQLGNNSPDSETQPTSGNEDGIKANYLYQ